MLPIRILSIFKQLLKQNPTSFFVEQNVIRFGGNIMFTRTLQSILVFISWRNFQKAITTLVTRYIKSYQLQKSLLRIFFIILILFYLISISEAEARNGNVIFCFLSMIFKTKFVSLFSFLNGRNFYGISFLNDFIFFEKYARKVRKPISEKLCEL